MRKNFFKKLSFVMALAMIVSVIAPAAGVFAATGLKLSSVDKTLHLSGQPGPNKYNFNIDGNKEKGWKYSWTSSKEDVAEVNAKNGVTVATGIGKADITVVITDKKGAEVATLTAKVTVKDNIKTVAIANAPEKALAVGEEYDFNRSFVTLTGSTTKTTAVTRWSLKEETDKATIVETDGKFKASEAGKYTVVARSFQSNAKYDEWKKTKAEGLLLAEASAEVTVKASIVETKQFDLTKFTVTFDSNMKNAGLSKDTATLYKIINGRDVVTGAEKIKNLTFDDSGKIATVELYADFAEEQEYKFVYGDLTGTFKAAKVDPSLVASIEFSNVNVNVNGTPKALLDAVIGKNKDGVIIYRGSTNNPNQDTQEFNNALSFEFAKNDQVAKAWLDTTGKQVYIYEKGYTVELTAKYLYYHFNTTTNQVETISWSDTALATGTEYDGVLITSSMQYAVATSEPASWDGKWGVGPFKLAAGDTGYKIFTRYKDEAINAVTPWVQIVDTVGRFAYESSNTDKLIVQTVGTTTYIYPVAAGDVFVLVRDTQNNNAVVGGFDVNVAAARGFASLTVEKPLVTVSNHTTYGTNGTVTKLVVTDTMGDAQVATSIGTPEKVYPNDKDLVLVTATPTYDDGDNKNKIAINVNAQGAPAGNYQYKVNVLYANSWKTAYINIQVIEANSADTKDLDDVIRWQLDVDKTEYDSNWDIRNGAKDTKTLNIRVAGYNKNNIKIYEAPVSQYAIKIEKDGVDVNNIIAGRYTETSFDYIKAVSGSYLSLMPSGTYVITATVKAAGVTDLKKAENAIIGRVTFTLKDSTNLTYDVATAVTNGTALDVVKNAFKFFINGNEVNDSKIISAVYAIGSGVYNTNTNNVAIAAGQTIVVKEVYVEDTDRNILMKSTPGVAVTAR